MTPYSVYWIRKPEHTNIMVDGYVGITARFQRRMWEHEKLKGNRHIKFAIAKYGWDNLIKTQLVIADEKYCLELEKKLRPEIDIGWNCTFGGGKPPSGFGRSFKKNQPSWNKGLKLSNSIKKKVSQSVKKLWEDPVYREHMSKVHKGQICPMKDKKHKPESIEKMRKTKLGKPSKKKGIALTEEQKANLSKSLRSNPWTCPHCKTVGYNIGAGNRWHFDNCKLKGN